MLSCEKELYEMFSLLENSDYPYDLDVLYRSASEAEFIEAFDSATYHLILKGIDPEKLYKIYNLIDYRFSQQAMRSMELNLLQRIVNAFILKTNPALFVHFCSKADHLWIALFNIFYDKSAQYTNVELLDSISYLSANLYRPPEEFLYMYLQKFPYKFNIFFDIIPYELRMHLFDLTLRRGHFDFNDKIMVYIRYDQNFRQYFENSLTEYSPIITNFIRLEPWHWLQYSEFTKIICENKKSLSYSIQNMIDTAKRKFFFGALIILANGVDDKKEILKYLIAKNETIHVEQFMRQFEDDPEIKTLIPFI